ncbi:ATP-binding cassette domain-containing protein [Myceligenerans pegani]|uniref:ATP-binding cassette domain-containing protein n=1 Tax=Myceligenerans pegani TaxID=2776917 RepID=A0ABR9MX62_9MICO|nr:ATP-binding cassette domain-containing protein [Myceligenerans sp. TRM 65318]MBE1875514.1 ATP-binding cassette domain-containing protein [Myceligenerans sp. TRM 65318]MBE3017785.1 ATP-binding cassette domain-containing protein [Myceligenerans sp. TRM 65318]
MRPAFQVEGLVKKFGATTALDGVDLRAQPGTVLGVLGPNGAGKTTAIRILATMLRPDAGTVEVDGLDVVHDAVRVRRTIGLTGQYATVDEDLTGTENLVLFGRLLDLPRAEARARAARLLDRFGLTEAAGRRAATYSGGMRRRLDLAASLVGEPRILFLDEPTTGLDPGKREELWQTIRGLADDGTTVLLTTQYLEEADALADEISVIDHGRVIAHDTPAGLKQQVGGQTVVVRPRDPARLPAAAGVVGRVVGRPVEAARGVVTAPVPDEHAFTEIVRALEHADVPVTELALRLPSLDEAFFTLTGHPAELSGSASGRSREEP